MMHTLRYTAGWSCEQIASELGFTTRTVYRIVGDTVTPRKKHDRGRNPILDFSARRRLFATATQDAYHRRLPWTQIADICDIQVL